MFCEWNWIVGSRSVHKRRRQDNQCADCADTCQRCKKCSSGNDIDMCTTGSIYIETRPRTSEKHPRRPGDERGKPRVVQCKRCEYELGPISS